MRAAVDGPGDLKSSGNENELNRQVLEELLDEQARQTAVLQRQVIEANMRASYACSTLGEPYVMNRFVGA